MFAVAIENFFAVINTPFGEFIRDNPILLTSTFTLVFIVRIGINNEIYNNENNTDFPFFGIRGIKLHEPGELEHGARIFFTIWFFKYKLENKKMVLISNILALVIFAYSLILLFWVITMT